MKRPEASPRLGRAAAWATVLLWALSAPPACAQDAKPTDDQVKAVYLAKFGKFVEWPASARPPADDKFNICVLGPDPFGSILDNAIQGETVGRATLAVRHIAKVEDASACRILFIPSANDGQIKTILAALGPAPVLTVSDASEFTRRGGMIQFVIEGNRVHFEVNLASARRVGLTLSSDLLKLATAIRRTP